MYLFSISVQTNCIKRRSMNLNQSSPKRKATEHLPSAAVLPISHSFLSFLSVQRVSPVRRVTSVTGVTGILGYPCRCHPVGEHTTFCSAKSCSLCQCYARIEQWAGSYRGSAVRCGRHPSGGCYEIFKEQIYCYRFAEIKKGGRF